MNTLCRHIESLLIEHNCVIVPHLGGFIAHECSAQYVEEEQLFLPPYRCVSFNQLLQHNDGLLAQSYIKAHGYNYAEALHQISVAVDSLRARVECGEVVELNGLGFLRVGGNGLYEFEPLCGGLLTPHHYALGGVCLPRLSQEAPRATHPSKRNSKKERVHRQLMTLGNKRFMRYVAAVLAIIFYFVWTAPLNHRVHSDTTQALFGEALLPTSSSPSALSLKVDSLPSPTVAPLPMPKVKAVETKKEVYSIVLASKVSRIGANQLIATLHQEGYTSVHLQESAKLRRVLLGRFTTRELAEQELQALRKQDSRFSQSWIIKD